MMERFCRSEGLRSASVVVEEWAIPADRAGQIGSYGWRSRLRLRWGAMDPIDSGRNSIASKALRK